MASKYKINKVAVIGAGVMGGDIAGLLAYVGIPVYLLDIVPPNLSEEEKKDPKARNKFALSALERIVKEKKIPPKITEEDVKLITPGNMEDNLDYLSDADWILEVVVEDPKIKQKVFETVEKYAKPTAIISSNTSGIPIKVMTEGRSDDFKKRLTLRKRNEKISIK